MLCRQAVLDLKTVGSVRSKRLIALLCRQAVLDLKTVGSVRSKRENPKKTVMGEYKSQY